MERLQTVNLERILWCCADKGITLDILASDLNLKTSLELLQEGKPAFTYGQLRKVAGYFGRGVLFFLDTNPVNEEKVHTPQFRTLANQKPELTAGLKELIQRAENQKNIYLALKEDLTEEDLPTFAPPDIDSNLPMQERTEVVREWLGLADGQTFDHYRTAIEAKGILVFRSNGYNGKWQIPKDSKILGFSIYDPSCPVIVVKKQPTLWEARQTFTLIHELGHLLLQKQSSIDDENDMFAHAGMEQEANEFAGLLLVSPARLSQIDVSAIPVQVEELDEWLKPHRHAWGVSAEVILRRLMDTGLISQTLYSEYRNWWTRRNTTVQETESGGTRMYRCREPKHIFGDTFVRVVLDALNSHQITLTKASKYLDGLKLKDLHALEAYCASV